MNPQVFGFSAAICLVLSLIPQLYHTYNTKKVEDLSYLFLFIQIITGILFLTYGLLLNETPLIVANICVLTQLVLLLIMKKKYTS